MTKYMRKSLLKICSVNASYCTHLLNKYYGVYQYLQYSNIKKQ